MDKKITIWLNKATASDFMLAITEPSNWYISIGVVIALLIAIDWKKGIVATVVAALALAIGDGMGAHILKPFFERPRPCHDIQELITLAGCSSSFSFPSNHAINSFAIATAAGLIFRQILWVGIPLAMLVALSRIAVGVHYLSDVVAGSVIGVLVGYTVAKTVGARIYPMGATESLEEKEDEKSGIS